MLRMMPALYRRDVNLSRLYAGQIHIVPVRTRAIVRETGPPRELNGYVP
jgi:hypothetical protein